MTANQRLSQEYDAIQNQTVDAQQLTMQIDHLLDHYQSVVINGSIPRHLALDRDLEDVTDFLEATTMGPVKYAAVAPARVIVTAADNPEVAVDEALATENVAASLNEFRQLIMREANHGVVDHDLTFNSRLARDEVVRLASAPGYRHLESFAPFGRPIISAQVLVRTPRISLQLVGETFRVWLPQGFEIWFAKESQDE